MTWPNGESPSHISLAITVLLLGISTASVTAQSSDPTIRIAGETMGTTYSVVLASLPENLTPVQLQAEIDSELVRVNSQMSNWDPESEISQFNALRSDDWFEVSVETAEVVAESNRLSQLSEGAFDVTVAPLVQLWGFGSGASARRVPSSRELDSAREHVGYDKVEVRFEPSALRKVDPNVVVDLSAIAKGYGVDRVASLLDSRSISGYLVEIGGEVRARGVRPSGEDWRVGIESPNSERRELQLSIRLGEMALATSGDYRQFYEIDGQKFSHVIDPRTGAPVTHQLASVSVCTDRCATADALATTLLVLGPDAGFAFAEANDLAAYFIIREGERLVEKQTPAFARLIIQPPQQGLQYWQLLIAALIVFSIAILGMAVGVVISNRRIKGSCGGLASMRDNEGHSICMACSTPSETCREMLNPSSSTAEQSSADGCSPEGVCSEDVRDNEVDSSSVLPDRERTS